MEISQKQVDEIVKGLKENTDATMKEVVTEIVAKGNESLKAEVEDRVKKIEGTVMALRSSKHIFGRDASGLNDEEKVDFAKKFIEASNKKGFSAEDPAGGGILIPQTVFDGIFRVAQTVGLVARFAQKFPMSGISEMRVPSYSGASLEGAYVGDDDGGSETSVSLGDVLLRPRNWQVTLRIPIDLLRNANVAVADWIIGLLAEGLSYKIDKMAFMGVTPFVGIFNNPLVPVVSLASGAVTYAAMTYDKASEMISNIEESQLDGSGFLFHRTVLHSLRIQKDSANNYLITNANPVILSELGSGLRAQGAMLQFPIFTSPILPKTSDSSQNGKIFGSFGNLKNVFFADGGGLEVAQSDSAVVGGSSVFEKRQIAFRVNHKHAIVVGLPSQGGLVNVKTSAS